MASPRVNRTAPAAYSSRNIRSSPGPVYFRGNVLESVLYDLQIASVASNPERAWWMTRPWKRYWEFWWQDRERLKRRETICPTRCFAAISEWIFELEFSAEVLLYASVGVFPACSASRVLHPVWRCDTSRQGATPCWLTDLAHPNSYLGMQETHPQKHTKALQR